MASLRDLFSANPFLTDSPAKASGPVVSIILPLFNAADVATTCLASVARHTSTPFRLLLINDGSTDPRVRALLAGLGSISGLVVVDRPDNLGFVVTINEGLALTPNGDVVILNSDTVVTSGWLGKLCAVARSRSNVATVTPLTSNGTICSVPVPLVDNPIPAGFDIDSFAELVARTSRQVFPEAPTGVGFCMLMTRQAIDAIGGFDAEAFGAGYGEETDFCQRAIAAGFVNLIADHTFVYHQGGASFGERTADLLARHLAVVSRRHPRYDADVEAFCRQHPLRDLHAALQRAVAVHALDDPAVRTRVLHVLHHDGGGTEKHARDLAAVDDPSVASCVLVSDGHGFHLDEYRAGRRVRSLHFPLPVEIGGRGLRHDAGYRDAFAAVCWSLGVDVIHVHHLMANTLDIADVAGELNIPFVMTLHDFYMACPSYTLLNPAGRFCGACLEPTPTMAIDACMKEVGQPAAYLPEHQERAAAFMRRAARIIAPNESVRELFARRFPEISASVAIIEHGHRRAVPLPPSEVSFDGTGSLNVAVIGNFQRHKGSGVLRDLLRANRNEAIVFHLYGTTTDPELSSQPGEARTLDGSTFIYHGEYRASDIVTRLRAGRIHVGLQLAVWPETFSYTISEMVEAGVPVISGDLGAQGDRIRRFGLGWTVKDIRDPSATLEILESVVRRPSLLSETIAAMRREDALTPLDLTWQRYLTLYRDLTSATRTRPAGDDLSIRKSARAYLHFLTDRLAQNAMPGLADAKTQAELAEVRERLRSPRHRIAETVGNAIQRIPLVRPVLAWVTDAFLARERRRRTAGE